MPADFRVTIGQPPSGVVGGLRMTAGEALWPGLDVSGTAYTIVTMGRVNSANGTSRTFLTGDTAGRVSKWAVQRLGSGGFWTANSIGLYRHTTNQDIVWTTDLLLTQADGLFIQSVGKVLGGGVPADVSQWVVSGDGWVHDTDSPTTTNFQLANGGTIGVDGLTVAGSFRDPSAVASDRLDGDDLFLLAIIPDLVDISSAVAAKSTAALLELAADGWVTDFKDGLDADLTGGGRDRVSVSGGEVIEPPDPALWTPGA